MKKENWRVQGIILIFSQIKKDKQLTSEQGEVGVCQLCALWVSLLWFTAPAPLPLCIVYFS